MFENTRFDELEATQREFSNGEMLYLKEEFDSIEIFKKSKRFVNDNIVLVAILTILSISIIISTPMCKT